MKSLPYLSISVCLLLTVSVQGRPATDGETSPGLRDLLHRRAEQHYPENGAGAVALVQKDGRVLLKEAYGKINLEHDVPASVEMKFYIASITKQFAAVAVLMLMEEGKLRLEDEIDQHLPQYGFLRGSQIRIRHLLGHTSGLPDYAGENLYDHHGTDPVDLGELLRFLDESTPNFEAGRRFEYSNAGYLVIQSLIEKLSGQSFKSFIQKRIFDPLEMSESGFYSFYDVLPGFSKGYEYSETDPKKIVHAKAVRPGEDAAGSIISTLQDLSLWYDALENNALISAESKLLAFTSQTLTDGRVSKYGLGWRVARVGEFTSLEHGGNNHCAEAYILFLPEAHLRVMVLSNLNRSYPEDLALDLAKIALGHPERPDPIQLSDEQLAKLAGRYRQDDGTVRTISLSESRLFSQRNDGGLFELVPIAKNRFAFKDDPDSTLLFVESDGAATAMELDFRTSPVTLAERVVHRSEP